MPTDTTSLYAGLGFGPRTLIPSRIDAVCDIQARDDRPIEPADWTVISSGLGRNELPELLEGLLDNCAMSWAAIREALAETWTLCEYPEQAQKREWWVEWFRDSGYAIDGKAADRPMEPLVLWRGAAEERKDGMAWTSDRKVAEWFRDRFVVLGPAHLYRATVEPERLLAHIHEGGRNESEYVIDTDGLDIERVES